MNDVVVAPEPFYQNSMYRIDLRTIADQDGIDRACLQVTNRDTGIVEITTLRAAEAYAHAHNSEERIVRVKAASNVIPFRRTKQ
jgi:hypothetical protein